MCDVSEDVVEDIKGSFGTSGGRCEQWLNDVMNTLHTGTKLQYGKIRYMKLITNRRCRYLLREVVLITSIKSAESPGMCSLVLTLRCRGINVSRPLILLMWISMPGFSKNIQAFVV